MSDDIHADRVRERSRTAIRYIYANCPAERYPGCLVDVAAHAICRTRIVAHSISFTRCDPAYTNAMAYTNGTDGTYRDRPLTPNLRAADRAQRRMGHEHAARSIRQAIPSVRFARRPQRAHFRLRKTPLAHER